MTRINCVPVQELCNKHLFAEWRELPRINKYIEKSLNSSNPINIPPEYVLGTGHVKFFYTKLSYLLKRYNELTNELLERGYNIERKKLAITGVAHWFNQWEPTEEAMELNRQRIKERLPNNPKYGKVGTK